MELFIFILVIVASLYIGSNLTLSKNVSLGLIIISIVGLVLYNFLL